jgi:hypothetical protein
MELREIVSLCNNSTLHRLRLGLSIKSNLTPGGENGENHISIAIMANKGHAFHGKQSSKPARQADPRIINIPANPPLPSISGPFCQQIQVETSASPRSEHPVC